MTASGQNASVAGPREAAIGNPLFEYLLRLGDDRLILGHRLSEWCGHGPILEEDIALSNISLDLIGHASLLLTLAGEIEAKGRDQDALAFFRDPVDFRNAQIVELEKGDFAFTIVRQFLFAVHSMLVWDTLQHASHAGLAGIAAKALKEDTYHVRHTSGWMLKLGDGTPESHQRAQRALDSLWRFTGELFESDAVDAAVADMGITVDQAARHGRWRAMTGDVVGRATLVLPPDGPMATGGRRGRHTEFLGHLLSEMQSVARAHPGATW